MKILRLACLAAAALIVAACLPVTTKNPIGTTVGFKSDPALIGIWKGHGRNDSKDGYLTFMNNGDGTMTALLFSRDEDEGEWATYTLEGATLGENRILNARAALKNGKAVSDEESSQIMPLLYRFEKDGSLSLSLLDEKSVKAAIRSGRLKGEVGEGDAGDARITEEPAALDAFFGSKEAGRMFSEDLLVMRRAD
ncbi:MAG TPA: hypothetical protein VHC42_12535 [Rhizomicrobium sp.]|nr:hypothetical protein [Rhizomicrobium sp.]